MKINKKLLTVFVIAIIIGILYFLGGWLFRLFYNNDINLQRSSAQQQEERGIKCGNWYCRPTDVECISFPNAGGGTSYACKQPNGIERVVGSIGTGGGSPGDSTASPSDSGSGSGDDLPGIDLTIEDLFALISRIACWLWSVSMLLIVIFIILAGIRFMAARSDSAAFTGARKNFVNVIIGAAVIMGTYVIIATVAHNIGVDISLVPFTCSSIGDDPATEGDPIDDPGDLGDGTGGGGGEESDICVDLPTLAERSGVPYPAQNAPELNSLISCIRGKLPGEQLGSIFTYDVSHPTCNYTRGEKICDTQCSHVLNSCHYGGRSGTEGALAVDFGNEKIADKIIQAAQSCGAKNARCEGSSGGVVSCSSSSAINVNVTAAGCDVN